ncbi:MAG: hypothetical protein RR281_04740 [Pseudoflavonifractor sp.]
MKKRFGLISLLLGLVLLLCGCGVGAKKPLFRATDDLYTLPKLPEEYRNLQAKIEEVTTGMGAEYSAPLRGTNTQPVQLQDLDGDGVLEAIAFFKVSKAGDTEKPLRIYIFRQTEDGYEVGAVLEGGGAAINSITYENLNDSPAKELVVSWQASVNVYTLAVYSIEGSELVELMSSGYTSYEIMDIDMDNKKEILILYLDTVEGSKSRLDCWDSSENSLVLSASAPMSLGVTGLDTDPVRRGYLKGETPIPALFVTSIYGDGIITDIFAWKSDTLKNITLRSTNNKTADDPGDMGVSYGTYRVKDSAKPTDINDDSFLELPIAINQPLAAGELKAGELAPVQTPTFDAWYQFDLDGNAWLVYTTYHNFDDGWYFILPQSWEGVTTVAQNSVVGEKGSMFGHWQDESSKPFFTIYKLTGPNRHTRARLGQRFTLASDGATIYCAEFVPGSWSSGLDEAGAKDQFKMIKPDWTAGG